MKKLRGIDISEHQGMMDYDEMAKNLDFVIIREGCRQRMDEKFLQFVHGFKKAGVDIKGVYHFIYALNAQQAKEEAESTLRNIRKASLPKTTYVFADFEYDTIDNGARNGVILGEKECNEFTRIFCETIQAAGYPVGIYTNLDYYNHMYDKELLNRYPLWLCDLQERPKYPCLVWQYSWNGRVAGYGGDLDADFWFQAEDGEISGGDSDTESKTESNTQKIINSAMSWMINLAQDDSHGYSQYNRWGPDYDCSSAIITSYKQAGVPLTCTYTGNMKSDMLRHGFKDVTAQVNRFNGTGMQPGDVLLNEEHHTAMYIGNGQEVEASIAETGGVHGQTGDQTGREILIRPYRNYPWDCVLRYVGNDTPADTKPQGALSKVPKWVGKVTATELNVRTWAGVQYPNIKSWPILKQGNLVDVCDTVNDSNGNPWYYIRIQGTIYGFVSAKYIKRV